MTAPIVAAMPLVWTPQLAEAYWRGASAAAVPALDYERNLANSMAAVLAGHLPPLADVLELGGRSAGAVASLVWGGLRVTRLDAQSLCEALPDEILHNPGFTGTTDRLPAGGFDAVACVDGPARVLESELHGFAALVRTALRPGGLFCFTVPNGARLDYEQAIDPETGVMFHPLQHQRSYTSGTIDAWLASEGFGTIALHQIEIAAFGTAGGNQPFARMRQEPRLYLGNGDTMLVVARRREQADSPLRAERPFDDAARADGLLAIRQQAARAARPPTPRRHGWTPASTDRFWSLAATTPLDQLSFGVQNGPTLLAAVEPWLSPTGSHIDVGAGGGHVVGLLSAAGYRAGAFEPAEGRRTGIEARLGGMHHYLGCFDLPDPAVRFDVALALEVIEHIPEPGIAGFLGLIRDSLAADGVLILSTPRAEALATSDVYSPVSGAVFHRWQHLQSWSPERLAQTLEAHGFHVEVTHEIDLHGIGQGRHPFFAELLGGTAPRRIGDGSNLICIARKGGRALGPLQPPATLARRFASASGIAPAAPPRLAVPVAPPPEAGPQGVGSSMMLRNALRALARALPRPVKAAVLRAALAVERRSVSAPPDGLRLADLPPLLEPDRFSAGSIVLVNNALAWGGVERQVVNTLRGLEPLVDRELGLLCLRLGNGPDYDFYLPALRQWRGFVRNAMESGPAEAELAAVLTPAQAQTLDRLLGWLPGDVREETRRFIAEFHRMKPAVVHVWQDSASISAGFAARITGVPRVIVSSRNMNPTNFAYSRPYMVEAYRALAACPEIVMVNNSEAGADDYAAWLGLPRDRFTVKRNGVDLGDFHRADAAAVTARRAALGIPEGAPVVGGIFRLYEEKRPLLWLAAATALAARMPDCHFVIFGTGPLTETLRAEAAKAGLAGRLHLPGTIADAAAGLSLFDVLVLTSRFEGTPNVVLEATTLGVPVVATRAGGTAETILEGRTGHVVGGDDPAEIAARIAQILEDREGWAARRDAGAAFMHERFGLDRMLRETLALYRLAPAGPA